MDRKRLSSQKIVVRDCRSIKTGDFVSLAIAIDKFEHCILLPESVI